MKDAIEALDEFFYRAKQYPNKPVIIELKEALRPVMKKWALDWDQHRFVSIPHGSKQLS